MFLKAICDGVVLWSLKLHGVRPLKHVRTCWHASAPTNRKCASQGTHWTMPARSEGHGKFSNSPPRALTLRCVVLLGVVRLLHTRLACHCDLPLQNVLAVLIIVINTALLAFFFYVASRKFWPSVIRRVTPKSRDKLPETALGPASRKFLSWPSDFPSTKRGKLYTASDTDRLKAITLDVGAGRLAPMCNLSDVSEQVFMSSPPSVFAAAGAAMMGRYSDEFGSKGDRTSSHSAEANRYDYKSSPTGYGHVSIRLD